MGLPELSNCGCLPGRAGGFPFVLVPMPMLIFPQDVCMHECHAYIEKSSWLNFEVLGRGSGKIAHYDSEESQQPAVGRLSWESDR